MATLSYKRAFIVQDDKMLAEVFLETSVPGVCIFGENTLTLRTTIPKHTISDLMDSLGLVHIVKLNGITWFYDNPDEALMHKMVES